jgi:hypothetical protein
MRVLAVILVVIGGLVLGTYLVATGGGMDAVYMGAEPWPGAADWSPGSTGVEFSLTSWMEG